MKAKRILSALLVCAMLLSIMGLTAFASTNVAEVNGTGYETLQAAVAAADDGDKVTLLTDVETSSKVNVTKSITIDGADYTLTYTGTDRAITVENTAAGVNLTVENLTVVAAKAQRGINYNTTGSLTLENVTVDSKATYAVNFPSSADGAVVTITGCDIKGLLALNLWGENMVVTVTNTDLTSIDESTHEDYAAIKLNNDGVNIANGTVVNVTGGSITALKENGEQSSVVSNGTETGVVNIDASTEVNGKSVEMVAVINYGENFYSFDTLEEAIDYAKDGNTIKLIADVTPADKIVVDKNIALDLNGKTLTLPSVSGNYAVVIKGSLTINDSSDDASGEVVVSGRYGIGTSTSCTGGLTVNGGTFSAAGENDYLIGAYAGEVVINGGTFAADYCAINSFDGYTASVVINDGTFSATDEGAMTICGDNFTIKDGEFTSPAYAVYCDNLTITGGTFDSEFVTVLASNATISGGTFTGPSAEDGYTIYALDSVEISGGSFDVDVSEYLSSDAAISDNGDGTFGVVAEEIKWSTATDAGAYMDGKIKYGMMRFLFALNVDKEDVTASGIKYLNADSISTSVSAAGVGSATGAASNAFYGDVTGIPENTTGNYYAVAFVTVNGKTYWSAPLGCTPNFEKVFANYGGAN